MTDYVAGATIHGKFTTFRPSTGAPFTLAGTPAISVYKSDSTTQSTSGVTLTVDFDTVTGLNHYTIDTSSDGTFYSAGSDFDIVVTTGTVDSVSAVGMVVGHFTIAKSAAYAKAVEVDTAVDDLPTNSELATALSPLALEATLTAMKGATFDTATDSLEAIRNRGDLAWITATGFSTLTQADIRTAVGLDSANLDTQLADIPTVAEFEARTLVSASYALEATLTTIGGLADAIKAKTDQLTFTGGYVDANAKSMNDAPIAGTGTAGDLWRGV